MSSSHTMDGGAVQKLVASKILAHNNKNFGARRHIKIDIQPQPRGFIFRCPGTSPLFSPPLVHNTFFIIHCRPPPPAASLPPATPPPFVVVEGAGERRPLLLLARRRGWGGGNKASLPSCGWVNEDHVTAAAAGGGH